MNMKEKRGLQMAITTIIMIILSIAILTILIVFLNSQTGFLSKWFKTQTTQSNVDAVISACDGLVISGSVYAYCCEKKEIVFGTNEAGKPANVDDIVRGCEVACVGQSQDAFCRQVRTVKFGQETLSWNGTAVSKVTSSQGTCENMTSAVNYPNVKVKACPNLC
jgi:hypothetical protein